MSREFDIIAIGGGAAGLVTAAGAAGLGARVALIERHRMGGECLWTGCVPSKALLACARAAADARDATRFGVKTQSVEIDFRAVMAHVRAAQRRIEPNDSPERFRSLGVEVISGEARFTGERTLRVDQRQLSARHIVIATGSRPVIPDIPGLSNINYHTNETIFELTELPRSMVVLGAGAIGVELAQAFALLGTRVTLIECAPSILPHEDRELTAIVAQELRNAGVTLKVNETVNRIDNVDDAVVLVATGRKPVLDTLDLARGSVNARGDALVIDDKLRTTARNVWAAGDVTGGPRYTHVADYQARTVLRNALFPFSTSVDYDMVPRVTYTIPELARVGLTFEEALERHGDGVRVFTRSYGELDRAIADGRTTGMIKIITGPKGRVLGGHVLGHHASSIIAEVALAMRENIPLSRIAQTLHAYPSYAESVKHSADAYVRSGFKGFAKSAANWLVRRV